MSLGTPNTPPALRLCESVYPAGPEAVMTFDELCRFPETGAYEA